MKISPKEIASVDVIGELNGSNVSLLKTTGGLWIAVGKRNPGGGDEVLFAGNHPAIVRHKLKKSYSFFKPSMNKNEGAGLPEAVSFGIYGQDEAFFIENGHSVDIILAKGGMQILKAECSINDNQLKIEKIDVKPTATPDKGAILAQVVSSYSKKNGYEVKDGRK